jgi:hypothetical protein
MQPKESLKILPTGLKLYEKCTKLAKIVSYTLNKTKQLSAKHEGRSRKQQKNMHKDTA